MQHQFSLFFKRSLSIFVVVVTLSLLLVSCQEITNEPQMDQQSQQGILNSENPLIKAAISIQEKHTASLMNIDDVVGTAVGLTDDGKPLLLVFTKIDINQKALRKGAALPQELEKLPVQYIVTGEIVAYKGGAGHTSKQTLPIQLGTSGGWALDLANGYCCGGTLGSLVKNSSGKKYVLSNYHVLYSDIVNGGNGRTWQAGDNVIQPGLIDVSCNRANAQNVAKLVSNGGSLPNSNVDAGIAEIITGQVREDGAILEVGTISSQTIGASINQAVKKSGRTTGLTRSTITGLNAIVSITYDNECAGGTSFTKTFTGQVVIANRGSKFLNSGDSGSLMVQDVTTNPRAIGLLFAGSNTVAIANPIGKVLNHYGLTMVGL